MQKLVEGIHHFQNDIFGSQQSLFERLVDGQHPLALFITCSDSRIDPSLLTQTKPGELFIMRNAGNIVPPHGTGNSGEAATIEFAVRALKVKDIVICGHSHCGAMGGLLNPESLEDLPAVRNWLSYAEATKRVIQDKYKHITDPNNRLTATVEENVLIQVENLRTHPAVAAALAQKQLGIHAWVYKFETGGVFAYSPQSGQYEPIQRVVTSQNGVPISTI
ncbi:MAG: carbonic anhydrase [Planctomycetales bacterium]|nr:carbonic anhydrase [Planctomycetales bacterium]